MVKICQVKRGDLVVPKVGECKGKFVVVLTAQGEVPNVSRIVGVSPEGHRVSLPIRDVRYATADETRAYEAIEKIFAYGALLVIQQNCEAYLFKDCDRGVEPIEKSVIDTLFRCGILYSEGYFISVAYFVAGESYRLKTKAIYQFMTHSKILKSQTR